MNVETSSVVLLIRPEMIGSFALYRLKLRGRYLWTYEYRWTIKSLGTLILLHLHRPLQEHSSITSSRGGIMA